MKNLVLYLHGKGGSARESEHYKPLFPGCEVLGLDYRGAVPWEAGPEIRAAVDREAEKAGRPLAVEVGPILNFFPAEEYHQKYLDKNPGGYCHVPRGLLKLGK
jgi:hypothetical protein